MHPLAIARIRTVPSTISYALLLRDPMKRYFFIFFLVLLTVGPTLASEGAYVFIFTTRGNSYWNAMAEGVQEMAKAKGVKAVTYNTDSATDAEQQLNLCLTALQNKPKAVIMAALNPSVATQCYKAAAAQGVMIADIDGSFSVAAAKEAGLPLAFSVGSDNAIIGQEAAKYLAQSAGKPDPKIFILEGVVGNIQGQKRISGFKNKIEELLPKAKIVASITADYDRLKAMNVTLDLLQREPDLDVIYAANDSMALGAAEAARNLHREKQLKIIGIDGTIDARKAIEEGRLTATVAQLPYLMGRRAIELALAGPPAPGQDGKSEITPTPVLTKTLLDANKDPLLKYVR